MNAEQATNTTNTTTTTDTGRDARGRFMPGNSGGPGNPFARKVAGFRKALLSGLTDEQFLDLGNTLMGEAIAGDLDAAKLLMMYSIGTPRPALEPDRMDANEWDVYREQAPMKTEAGVVMGAGTPEHHLHLVRTLRPVIADILHEQVMAMFIKDPAELAARAAKQKRDDKEMEKHLNSPLSDHPDLAAFAEEWNAEAAASQKEKKGQAAPSTNGVHGQPAPSTNGTHGPGAPSTNGTNGQAPPSTNGTHGQAPPSTNGTYGQAPPSTNGTYGQAPPSTNGIYGQAPSTNGVHGQAPPSRKGKKRRAGAPPGSPRPF